MVRQCHSNTCPVGVCTQRHDLRAKFEGTPEKVVQLFTHLAEEVREILATLGFSSLSEVTGRTDLLKQVSRGDAALDDLDLNPILFRQMVTALLAILVVKVELMLLIRLMPLWSEMHTTHLKMAARCSCLTILRILPAQLERGYRLIVRRFGMKGLREGQITASLRGSAGQSLGAFAVQGLRLDVVGDANDYVGKGLSGGMITVRPGPSARFAADKNTIIGNTVLYGATSGMLLANGQAGERLCVRNSWRNSCG